MDVFEPTIVERTKTKGGAACRNTRIEKNEKEENKKKRKKRKEKQKKEKLRQRKE